MVGPCFVGRNAAVLQYTLLDRSGGGLVVPKFRDGLRNEEQGSSSSGEKLEDFRSFRISKQRERGRKS